MHLPIMHLPDERDGEGGEEGRGGRGITSSVATDFQKQGSVKEGPKTRRSPVHVELKLSEVQLAVQSIGLGR
jgi:hypothetical protein